MRTIWTLGVLIGLAGLGCGRADKARRTGGERLPRLEYVYPVRGPLERRLDLVATVEALQRVDLSARVPGVVEELGLDMDIGRKVKGGEVLLRLKVPDLEADKTHKEALREQVKKQVTQAKEALAVAEREVEETQKEEKRYKAEAAFQRLQLARITDLVKRGAQDVARQQEVDRQLAAAEAAQEANLAKVATRQARVQSVMADIEVAQRRVRVAEAEVHRLATQIGFATVKAPFDGVISRRWVDKGAIIQGPGANLLTVNQIHRVRVLIDIPQRDVGLINDDERRPNPNRKGDPVWVRIGALAEVVKDGEVEGTITRTAQTLDPVTRTMRAEILLDNKDDGPLKGYLRPGMFGTASVLVEKRSNKLTVPASALVQEGEGKVYVYIIVPTEGESAGANEEQRGTLRRVEIDRGIDDGKVVEVRGGLRGNEMVVLRGNNVPRLNQAVLAIPAE